MSTDTAAAALAPEALLGAATAVRSAVVDSDVDALHDELCRLRNVLVEQLHERDLPSPDDDPPETIARLVRHGRRHLVHLIGELLVSTSAGGEGCTCLVRSGELHALLARQARLEHVLAHQT